MEMIRTENERRLLKEVIALKKQLKEKDHMINSLGENYVSQKEIHDALWKPFWEDYQRQGKLINRLKEEIEQHRSIFGVKE